MLGGPWTLRMCARLPVADGKPAHATDSEAVGVGITKLEAKRLVADGRDSNITFDEFHHFH
jgi:hypothetical protein